MKQGAGGRGGRDEAELEVRERVGQLRNGGDVGLDLRREAAEREGR